MAKFAFAFCIATTACVIFANAGLEAQPLSLPEPGLTLLN